MAETIRGRPLLVGEARGGVLALDEPISFWGGVDVATGRILGRHPQAGEPVTDRVLVTPGGRGSSSSSSVLAESIRAGTAPAAMVMAETDEILVLGAIVAEELYAVTCPVVLIDAADLARLPTGTEVSIGLDGTITVILEDKDTNGGVAPK